LPLPKISVVSAPCLEWFQAFERLDLDTFARMTNAITRFAIGSNYSTMHPTGVVALSCAETTVTKNGLTF